MPAAHAVHAVGSSWSVYVPAAHTAHAPLTRKLPALHAVHMVDVVAPTAAVVYVPAAHVVQADVDVVRVL